MYYGSQLIFVVCRSLLSAGELPLSWANLSLEFVNVYNNSLVGTLPEAWGNGNMSGVQYIELSYNNLTGSIPQGETTAKVAFLYTS